METAHDTLPAGVVRRRTNSASSKGRVSVSGRMDRMESKIDELTAHIDLFHTVVQRVETKMEKALGLLGEEKEDGLGNLVGTGMMGRLRRNENAVKDLRTAYKIWIAFGSGFIFSLGSTAAIVWWLIGDKLGVVLK